MSVRKSVARRRRPFARDALTNQSLQHSVYDGMAFAAMVGGGETYFTAFALINRVSVD